MTDKQVIVDLFNQKVDEFLRDLSDAFPDVKQFQSFKTAFTLMKNLDDKKPQKVFHEYVAVPYGAQIKVKNEQFFLQTKFDTSTSSRADYWEEFIHNLRGIWKNLGEKDKNTIWTYLQLLVKLDEKAT